MGSAATLTQINSRSSKRAKRELGYSSSYHRSPSLSHSAFSDASQPLGLEHFSKAFEQGATGASDHLSASFKSLYKSIFGHSVSSGEYLNPPPLPPSTVTELSSSDSSFPLGASAFSLLSSINATGVTYHPHFYTVMDSFRDIAETNSWDKLEPSQVQGLMESFRAAERDQFGLDAESYSRVSSSFERFFQELNSRCTTGSSKGNRVTELEYQSHMSDSGCTVTQPLTDTSPLMYSENPDSLSMFPISGASPPSSNYPPPPQMTQDISPQGEMTSDPTAHLSLLSTPSSQRTNNAHFETFAAGYPGQSPPLGSMATQILTADMPGKSAATDLFENDDDDDFDWSKLM